ncbi:hypothetical protein DVH24_028368 [Malus domestica]|uniref:Uncharacterized protein n=1 Tax=Malus domestica TaxID=3750 RepID=A0A498HGF6_MALDO|nr:hypothetical protein DVH24_028368 [Malus domestica]
MVTAPSSIAATVEKMEVEVSSAAENNMVVQEHDALAERDLQEKLQEQMAKRTTADNSDDVPISESDSIASVLISEATQAHKEELEAIMAIAVRIEPYVVDAEGHAFWKPKSDFREDILLQDIRPWDGAPCVENLFFVALK